MAKEFGWAYVVGSQASGPKGSIQISGDATKLDHDPNLFWSDEDNALLISGDIIAHNFEIQNQTKTVFNFEVSGSSIFGDTEDDLHQFTGSLDITGNVTALNYYGWGGDLDGVPINYATNFADNRIVTSVTGDTVNAEENLTFDGAILNVSGDISAIEIDASQFSGTIALFDEMEADTVISTTLTASALSSSTAIVSNSTFGDIVLTGRIVDANGNVILGTPTAQSEVNISNTNSGATISSTSFNSVNSSNAVGMDFAVISQGIELDTNAFVAKIGGVGVGTNQPAKKMEVYDNTGAQLRLSSLGSNQIINGGFLFNPLKHHTDLETNTEGMFSITPTGQRVGVNTTTPEHALDVSGDARITGNLVVSGTLSARVTDFAVSADTLTFGDESSDTIVMNAKTMTTPNDLEINNVLFVSESTVGVGSYSTAKFGVTSTSNQLELGNGSQNLSISVTNDSTSISTNNSTIDIGNNVKVLGELVVGSNGDIVLDNAGQLSSSVSVSSHTGHFTNITSSTITNGNTIITNDNVTTDTVDATTINTYWVNAEAIAGRLTTGNQTNIYALGTLSYLNVANATKLQGSLAVGINNASRKVEIKDSEAQLRLTNTVPIFGISDHTYADMHVNDSGDLSIEPSSGKVYIPSLNLANVPDGHSSKVLSVDENGNIIKVINQPGIEVRNRIETTTSYNMKTDDYFIALKVNEHSVITLPDASALANGQIFVLTDEIGSAGNYTLTIRARENQSIDGENEIVLVSPRSSVSLYTDGQSNFFLF